MQRCLLFAVAGVNLSPQAKKEFYDDRMPPLAGGVQSRAERAVPRVYHRAVFLHQQLYNTRVTLPSSNTDRPPPADTRQKNHSGTSTSP